MKKLIGLVAVGMAVAGVGCAGARRPAAAVRGVRGGPAATEPNEGEAYLGGNVGDEKSIKAFEAAARLRPDDLKLQTQLGRQYLAKGENDKALEHLRLATVTSNYGRDEDGSAVADYFLARALQAK